MEFLDLEAVSESHSFVSDSLLPHGLYSPWNSPGQNIGILAIPFSKARSYAAAAAKSCQLCPTLCNSIDSGPPGSRPWDSPGKNTGVGCHFLLQCRKVKSESEVAQSCPTLSDPMDCSLPGPRSMGFSRQEHWSGLPLPSPASMLVKRNETGITQGQGSYERTHRTFYYLIL